MNYQWYPGHMTKAKRMMQEDSRLVDLVIELVDARVPVSSRNPDIDEIAKGKSRIILLNKADLADKKYNTLWIAYFKKKGYYALEINSRTGAGIKNILPLVQEACRNKIERDRKRGIVNRPVRAMVVGIPNVGKSTFINAFAGRACTKTGNKPGITKGKQWIRLNKNLELLDTPGILWPKFEDQKVGERLAMIGSISDDILEETELAAAAVTYLRERYPGLVEERYQLKTRDCAEEAEPDVWEVLREICVSRRCFQKGEEPDLPRASRMVLDDFRSGKLGKITLEYPEEQK
ncbi:MAG: ribosome biogenesis GTPase YlqF [Clostridium sp.]|nr:ribosome biogenesis GTPase YlqF [Clostridium sp.]